MKYPLLFLIALISCTALAQERPILHARVISGGLPLENVHIKNVSSGKYAVSDEDGNFKINGAVKDTLLLSHISRKDLIVLIKEGYFYEQPLVLQMEPLDNELDEVTISKNQEINAVTLGIIPHAMEKPTSSERKLQTASNLHLQIGTLSMMQLDPIINAISGRTKRLKRNAEIDKQINKIAFLEYNYQDYMLEDLKIPEDQVQMFIDFLLEEESLQAMIDADKDIQMKLFLHDNWIKFQELR